MYKCVIKNNSGVGGGGVWLAWINSPKRPLDTCEITNCVFDSNKVKKKVFLVKKKAGNWGGGGIYITDAGEYSISDTSFIDNYSTSTGGAILTENIHLTLSSCLIFNNTGTFPRSFSSHSQQFLTVLVSFVT